MLIYALSILANFYQMEKVTALSEEIVPLNTQTDMFHEAGVGLEILTQNVDRFFVAGYGEDFDNANAGIDAILTFISSIDSKEVRMDSSSLPLAVRLEKMKTLLLGIKADLKDLSSASPTTTTASEINKKRSSVYSG
jgi:hypothetical protein